MVRTKSGKDTLLEGRLVISVSEAGLILEMSRDTAYRAAHSGEIPTIRIGNLLRVPVARFRKMLEGE